MADVDGRQPDPDMLGPVLARLQSAARSGESIDIVFAVRGRVARTGKPGRWRLRTGRGHVVTFRPEFVIGFNGTSLTNGNGAAPRR